MADIIVGIDTGGTFTDGFISDGKRVEKIKVDTTPHDLTVCFVNCLEEGARAFGFKDLRTFLREVRIVRFSSTTSTNILVQRIGDNVGLFVTKGFEKSLYEKDGKSRLPKFLLIEECIEGIDEEVKMTGKVAKSPNENDIMEMMKRLLDKGTRIVVISFSNAHVNSDNEKMVKKIIGKYYPKHYLGSLPVIPASEFCNHPDEVGRSNLALLNAYVHRKVSGTLYRAEDHLRDLGYKKSLLAVNNNGGCSRVAKTRAADITESSPVAGYIGSMYWAKKYEIPNVITIDIGGTSIDNGVIVDDRVLYSKERSLFGIPVATPVFEVSSVGLGGGSIAKVNMEAKTVQVGPESAGALPGPACYDLGGENPTITDADVVLNLIDPGYFLGGKRKLNVNKAREAIETVIAKPLGMDTKEASAAIINKATELWSEEIQTILERVGKPSTDFVLFAFGGAGPTHCCDLAERLGISKIYTFPFSSTFGAFGTSMMDLMHIYMRCIALPLIKNGKEILDIETFNNAVKEEKKKASRDMIGEGFKEEDIKWGLELEVSDESNRDCILMESPKLLLDDLADVKSILKRYQSERERLGYAGKGSANMKVEVFYLKGYCSLFKYEFQKQVSANPDPSHALKSERPVAHKGQKVLSTNVYNRELLKCGNIVVGPAILESKDTTYVLPKGWRMSVDEYLNGIIEKE